MSTVLLNPGDNIQAAVNANPAGTVFVLTPGVYRGQEIIPQDSQQFIGEPGAVLNGSVVLSNWHLSNGYWQATGLPTLAAPSGVAGSNPEAPYPNDLYFNDTVYTRVGSLSQMGHGTWYYDSATGTAYLSDNPTGATVELGVTPFAFGESSAQGVVIKGLTIEKYANPAQTGAIQWGGNGWHLTDDTVTLNHGGGAQLSQNAIVLGGRYIDNGELGIGAWHATNAKIIGAEVAGNNYAGFSTGWEAGGIKVDNSLNVQILDSYVHNNDGPGIWSDDNTKGVIYADNVVANNTGSGIVHEISYDAVIRDNVLLLNGTSTAGTEPVGGNGVFIHDSQNTQVYGNYVEVGANAGNGIGIAYEPRTGTGTYGPWQTINNAVFDNTIVHLGASGHDGNWPYQDVATALTWPNSFNHNHYVVPDANFAFFAVGNQFYNWSSLHQQQTAYEPNGTLTVAQYAPLNVVVADLQTNTVKGGPGDDVLIGNGANDTLIPGTGNDLLFGGQGNSTFLIAKGEGSDTIFDFHTRDVVALENFNFADYAALSTAITQVGSDLMLDLGGGQTLTFKGETITDLAPGNFALVNSTSSPPPSPPSSPPPPPSAPSSPDLGPNPVDTPAVPHITLTAPIGGSVHGTAADEILVATGSGETLVGGGGNDIFKIGTHTDATIDETKPGVSEVITSAKSYVLPAGIDNLSGSGSGSQTLTGNSGANVIYGGNGSDTLIGGAGNDKLVVGTGNSSLTGGSGDDVFVFSSTRDHSDIITDFTLGQDVVDFRPLLQRMHYTGTDPVADKVLQFSQTQTGDTVVTLHPSGSAAHTLVTIEHIVPQALHSGVDYLWH
jgi:Ca2+-binding RTX toxin-like protein